MFDWFKRLLSSSPAQAPAPAAASVPAPATQPSPAPTPAPRRPPGGAAAPPTVALAAATTPPAAPFAGPSFDQQDTINSQYDYWLFDRQDDGGLEVDAAEASVLSALATLVHSGQSGGDLVRRMPGLLPQVLQSLRNEQYAGAELARKISTDVVLVAAVIRLANHAAQPDGKTIGSVEHAIIVIGQEGLRQLVTAVAFRPIIDLKSGHYTRLLAPRIRDQSERCAIAARALAAQGGCDPFEAFLAGLLHQVGLLVALRMMDQEDAGRPLGSALFCARLRQLSGELSCRIAQEWRFPPAVIRAIAEQQQLARRGAAGMSAMGRVLGLGDYLSKARILREQGVLGDADSLFDGLPSSAPECYATLHAPLEATP